MSTSNYWELAKTGTLCDLTLIEETASGDTKKHSVHKLVVYASSPYIQKFFNSEMKDNNTKNITIKSERESVGLLCIVIEAMYATPSRAEQIYYTYTGEHNITEIMQLYMICSQLLLDEHIQYIQIGIKEFVNISDLTRWWREREDYVPPGVEDMVQDYLRASIKYIGAINEAFISVDALLNMWSKIDDPLVVMVREFLGHIRKAAKETGDENNPNEWMDNDDISEEWKQKIDGRYLKANEKHPTLYGFDETCWLNIETWFIFDKDEVGGWYVTGQLNLKENRIVDYLHLPPQEIETIKAKGWVGSVWGRPPHIN